MLYCDARESEMPDWKPSKKGVCLSVGLLAGLKEAVDKAQAYVEDGGQGANKDSAARTSREGQGEGGGNEREDFSLSSCNRPSCTILARFSAANGRG